MNSLKVLDRVALGDGVAFGDSAVVAMAARGMINGDAMPGMTAQPQPH